MKLISRLEAVELIRSTNGQIFTASFIKKDGSIRSMNCRFGVTKGVKGVGLKFEPYSYGLLPVYDMRINEFRMLNIGTLRELVVNSESYKIK